jgi:hypothetical protein
VYARSKLRPQAPPSTLMTKASSAGAGKPIQEMPSGTNSTNQAALHACTDDDQVYAVTPPSSSLHSNGPRLVLEEPVKMPSGTNEAALRSACTDDQVGSNAPKLLPPL